MTKIDLSEVQLSYLNADKEELLLSHHVKDN